ncbi:hypothetical protein NUU61_002290 [Penicillium alfredii]|uniref:SRR1-like domain-containing protein n=1 Tax=Penicillium alfredii TaxID=1506179 RepID=A0A9W9FRF8_9EURO|nr:uncharacterized protein NUU61_002290 [Penicillium alfredii]KAJ5104943.1 hypothetical protein NUU61_002290 [Penicillium alfredii]
MPHTARKRRTPQKRLQVTADDGWTHVTSGNNVRRLLRNANHAPTPTGSQPHDNHNHNPVLTPAEAPSRLTLSELQAQYRAHRERWEGSETWWGLAAYLAERLGEEEEEEKSSADVTSSSLASASASSHTPVDSIMCIGLGSPSGFLRDGWVDRRSVSLYQLAALASVKDYITQKNPSIPIYAQDPVFNTLDHALLESLGIKTLPDPAAFDIVTPKTLLFCPGAERQHLERLLPAQPALVFGGPLEQSDSAEIEAFVARTESRALRGFGPLEHAFWKMRVYFWNGPKEM